MTRRERLEARLEKRRIWAESRAAKSVQSGNRAHSLLDGIPPGQPVLVGHHSEKRHRSTLRKADAAMSKCVEHGEMAKEHTYKARGLEIALETSIFSDDPDAVEAIEAKIAALESVRDEKRELGAAWRKAKKPKVADEAGWRYVCELRGWAYGDASCVKAMRAASLEEGFMNRGPVPAYVLQNLGGNITRMKKRLVEVKRRQERTERVEAAGGFLITRGQGGYCNVQFAEKPERAIIHALKEAGFHWSGGMWCGYTEKIPACVLAFEQKASAAQ